MHRFHLRRGILCGPVAFLAAALSVSVASAQGVRGFSIVVPATPSGSELTNQASLWVLETHLKPLRMLSVELTDPETGKKERETIWYLVYKAVNRPLDRRERSDRIPVNEEDIEAGPPLFVPEFTLVATHAGEQAIYADELLPEAHAAIERRERMPLKNPVQIVGPIPDETPRDSRSEEALYGVATWRGIDPKADFYTVYMSGFSNGYVLEKGPDGNDLTLRKTIVVDFWRPGDEFNPNEREFTLRGQPRWTYRVDEPESIAADPRQPAGEAAPEAAPENANAQ